MVEAHPNCQGPRGHVCQQPSNRRCHTKGCLNPAGTLWTPYWCPDCDQERLNRISEKFQWAREYLASEGKE